MIGKTAAKSSNHWKIATLLALAGLSAHASGDVTLGNEAISATWRLDDHGLVLASLVDVAGGVTSAPAMPVFRIDFGPAGVVSAAELRPTGDLKTETLPGDPKASVAAERLPGRAVSARYRLPAQKADLLWRALLSEGSPYIRQEIALVPEGGELVLKKFTMLNLALPGAQVTGSVRGSPVVAEPFFAAIEHPAALSKVGAAGLGWSSSDFAKGNTPTTLELDAAQRVTGPGTYEIEFQYASGNHRLDVQRVRFLAGGKAIAADEHPGITGNFNKDNVYKLDLAAALAGPVTIEVVAFVDSSGNAPNSEGVIRVRRNGQAVTAGGGPVECSFSRASPLPAGKPFVLSSVIGVAPKGQMRRAFAAYLERERAHPYRPFLHYNSWYHLNIDRPGNRMTEQEALAAVEAVGTELTQKRGVTLASYVMDDGWDSHTKVWDFNENFPQGFANVAKTAAKFRGGVGLWMSPWGGYGGPKDARIKNGRAAGFEVNGNGFSMAGPTYRAHFEGTCLRMIRDYHANFFKFDGMGGGNFTDGGDSAYANDMDAILDVCRSLRRANPDVYISATVGTWPSPFWLRHADSIWRQGDDTAFAGVGSGREKWITYRDATVFSRIVKRAPLYPIHALMQHGIVIGERGNPARMERDEASVKHEARSFFGTGTALQELYISPHLLTPALWDAIADAAKWSARNSSILPDSHWIGGDPGKLEVYGFAAWKDGRATLTLRNPSDKPQTFALDAATVFELPATARGPVRLAASYADQGVKELVLPPGTPVDVTVPPFAVLVWETAP